MWDIGLQLKLSVLQLCQCLQSTKIFLLSLITDGDKIERFLHGLHPGLKRAVTIAPVGWGVGGKWTDP